MYIYDSQPTPLRGLGSEGSILYGLGRRPENPSPVVQPAEVVRLTEEITKLAGRNAWSGVERDYKQLESMGDEAFNVIPRGLGGAAAIHELGAMAADTLGNTQNKQDRLLASKKSLETMSPIDDVALRRIIESLDAIEKAYGAVSIAPRSVPTSKRERKRLQGRGPILTRVDPWVGNLADQGQRRSFEAAATILQATGSFDGLLPAGRYTVADQPPFTVTAGTELTGKQRRSIVWEN